MKLFTFILITASLVVGALSAGTAYVPALEGLDGSMGLTLNAPAGVDPADETLPLVDPDAADAPIALTDELIGRLRDAGVRRVQVKEFGFSRWEGRWPFLLACAGLLVGAFLVRRSAAAAVAATLAAERPPSETPEHALETAHAQVRQLLESIERLGDQERSALIVSTLDEVQREHLDAVSGAAAELTARLGAAGHAQLMDRFAAAERQLNRAWSAAADGVLDESVVCLGRGLELLEESRSRLR